MPRLSRYSAGVARRSSRMISDLVARLGQMDEQRHVVLVGQGPRRLSVSGASVYAACGAIAGVTSGSAFPRRDEPLRPRERQLRRFGVVDLELDHGLSEHARAAPRA